MLFGGSCVLEKSGNFFGCVLLFPGLAIRYVRFTTTIVSRQKLIVRKIVLKKSGGALKGNSFERAIQAVLRASSTPVQHNAFVGNI